MKTSLQTLKRTRRNNRNERPRGGIEQLDSRLLMTATQPREIVPLEPQRAEAAIVAPDELVSDSDVVNLDAPVEAVRMSSSGGSLGYPAPDGPDDWGPIGPVVRVAMERISRQIAEDLHQRIQANPRLPGGFSFDADGLLNTQHGLYVALAQNVMLTLHERGPTPYPWSVEDLTSLFHRELVNRMEASPEDCLNWNEIVRQTIGLGLGDDGYPNPDDPDGDWGPIGPVVREALQAMAEQFAVQLAESLGEGPAGQGVQATLGHNVGDLTVMIAVDVIKPGCDFGELGGLNLTMFSLQSAVQRQLELWFRDPDPNRLIAWETIAPELVVVETPLVGDVNHDGLFNSSDLIQMFQAGEYEDRIIGNSTFEEGDLNGDHEFDSSDLLLAFQRGHYEAEHAVEDLFADDDTVVDLLIPER